uniref:Uncharacterized protein n=1 Tax=Salix viminalis TaxID=40686 RepID=A0A6N2LV68_SALVM
MLIWVERSGNSFSASPSSSPVSTCRAILLGF